MKAGEQFELQVLRLVGEMGFQAITTKSSGDGGIDIVAISNEPLRKGKYVIQCKDWNNPVGEPPLRDLYGVVHSERANKGILITTSRFTNQAKQFAEGKPLELVDGQEYNSLLMQYGLEELLSSDQISNEDQDKFDGGYVKIVGYECNGEWNSNDSIGSFGEIIFKTNGVSFNGYPTLFMFPVSSYLEYGIFHDYDPRRNTPYFSNSLVMVKCENKEDGYKWLLYIEANQQKAIEVYESIKNRKQSNSNACFVATAVYGDNNCLQVNQLRKWRDNSLSKNRMGRKFIHFYYANGEVWAKKIEPYPNIKKIIRMSLDFFVKFID